MASWGIAPAEVARRFSEEALVELVPALVQRRARETLAYQLAQITKGMPGASDGEGAARVSKYDSGRSSRTYGSASQPLSGESLETAVRDIGRRMGAGRVH